MTLSGNAQEVNAVVQQSHFVSFREPSSHRALTLGVYRQLVERFGALTDVVLVQLSNATVEQLLQFEQCAEDAVSLEDFFVQVGWVIPQGGEGNFPMDVDVQPRRLSNDEHRLVQERLDCLRQARPLCDSAHPISAIVQRNHDSTPLTNTPPLELFASRYESDVLAVLI